MVAVLLITISFLHDLSRHCDGSTRVYHGILTCTDRWEQYNTRQHVDVHVHVHSSMYRYVDVVCFFVAMSVCCTVFVVGFENGIANETNQRHASAMQCQLHTYSSTCIWPYMTYIQYHGIPVPGPRQINKYVHVYCNTGRDCWVDCGKLVDT